MLFDEGVLSIHVGIDVVGMLERQTLLQGAVGLRRVWVSDHVIAKCQMPRGTCASSLKGMHLMSSDA